MKTTAKTSTTAPRGFAIIKLAGLTAMCGLAMLASALGGTIIRLDLGNNTLAANAAGFTKVHDSPMPVVNVAGSGYTLTFTNFGAWSPGTTYLWSDGFYHNGTGAGFILSGLPAGNTVAVYADGGWDRGAKMFYGGTTNLIGQYSGASPSMATLSYGGRAVVDANGKVAGTWIGPNGDQGQIGGMIFDIEPCQPALTLTGANPIIVPQHSTFTDPGATAVESCSGSTLTVTATGSVDPNTLSTNIITYTAIADGITNSITRTVAVVVSDFINLDFGPNGTSVPTPAGFTKLLQTAANMSFAVTSVGGAAYRLFFTNINAYSAGGTTLDKDGFYCNANQACGFTLSNLAPSSLVTLYSCWAWDGVAKSPTFTYGGSTTTLTVGSGITSPSITTLQSVGTAIADSSGVVKGTWNNLLGNQGQVGGMIFEIKAPASHSLTVVPSGVTNVCGGSATFTAAAEAGANLQWYNNLNAAITGATNSVLTLNNLHPANSGTYKIVASGSGWATTNSVVLNTLDTAPPTMTMNGNSLLVLKVGASYTDPGATAYDTCAGASLTVTTTGSVNTGVTGDYPVTYSATTAGGVAASVARRVIVIDDTVQPDVLLALDFGPSGDANPAPAGFTKVLGGALSSGNYVFSVGSGLTLNITNMGGYGSGTTISSDGFYNFGGQPATFTLSGLPAGTEATISAVYAWGGSGQGPRIVFGGATNTVTAGITTTNPTIADFQKVGMAIAGGGSVSGSWYGVGGPNTEGQIGGMVISVQSLIAHGAAISPATVAPQCGSSVTLAATVGGAAPFTYRWYDNNNNLIAGATNASVTLVNVRPVNVGTYKLIADNAYGSTTNTATVTGVVDAAPPVITLNGINPVNIVVHGAYTEPGATAFDLCAQSSVSVGITGAVDTSTVGSYTVTYSATTLSSGVSTNLTRTVNIIAPPNDTLQLDFAPTTGTIVPAPAGFSKVQNGPQAVYGNYSFPNVAGSAYTLSFTNIASYNFASTNEPLVTDGFYSQTASFGLSGLPQTAKVTLYAIWAWDGSGRGANIFFGGGNAQIANNGDPGTTPSLTNFTRIGAAVVGTSGAVTGHWQGPGGPTTEGQVGGMVILVGTNTPPTAGAISMIATNGLLATHRIVGGVSGPTDPDGDPLTVTAVQSPTAHNANVTTDGSNVTYSLNTGYVGQDTFSYTVGDGFGGFATATVTVNVTVTNLPPTASNLSLGAQAGQPATLTIIGGRYAPTDPENDPLTVTAVQSPTPNGGTVTTDGTNITYTSAGAFSGVDTFTYTVGDGKGGFATATVSVDVLPASAATGFNRVSGPTLVNGLLQMGYQGIPGVSYVLETTPSMVPPIIWTPMLTNQASANGVLIFSVPPSEGSGFFRTHAAP